MYVLVGDSSLFNRIIAFLLSPMRTILRCIEMIRETMTDNSFMSRLLDNSKTVYELHICYILYVYLLNHNVFSRLFICRFGALHKRTECLDSPFGQFTYRTFTECQLGGCL